MQMYQDYCAQAQPALPEVCTNEALKHAQRAFKEALAAKG